MYGIKGEFRRFCFDRAVFTFGSALENEMESATGKTSKQIQVKRERILATWLDQPLKFRNPTATAGPTASTNPTANGAVSVSIKGDGGGWEHG